MNKLLIIGSKGFIGSHAFEHFSSTPGTECWGCDVVVDYVAERYILLDSSNSDFNELFEEGRFDLCINCSGAASVPDSMNHPLRDFSLNTYNIIKILEAIRKHSAKCKFINLSSAAVYGNPAKLPVIETDNCLPVSPYGWHKLFAEELCREYFEFFKIECCSVRIFSAYGPRLKKQVLWDLFKKSKESGTVNMSGTGKETRDFIYIKDIVAAIDAIVKKGIYNASVYNVANGIEISVKELAEIFLNEIGYKGKLVFSGSERLGDPINWRADISKLKALGYAPLFTIRDGIKKYAAWLNEER
jgi:UDP-glucose 4-epimerase